MKVFAIVAGALIMTFFVPHAAISQSKGIEKLESLYGAYIEEYISKSQSKADMLRDTKSKNLSKQATLYCLKANFLKNNRKQLIDNLITYKTGLKPYKIQSILNKNFFNKMRLTMKKNTFYSCVQCGLEINLKTLRS
jgi:hypothetical protein